MVPADSSQADNPTAGEQLRREAADWLTAGRPPAGPMVGQRSLASGRRAFGQRVVEAEYLLAARERRASLVGIQAEAVAKASRCRGQKGGWPAVHRRKQQRRRVDLAEPASAEMRERRLMPANYCSPGPMAAEELAESPDWQASRPADARSPDKDRSLPAWGFLGHTNGNGSWANHDQETNHDQENCALQSSRLFVPSVRRIVVRRMLFQRGPRGVFFRPRLGARALARLLPDWPGQSVNPPAPWLRPAAGRSFLLP